MSTNEDAQSQTPLPASDAPGSAAASPETSSPTARRRRPRYAGKYPRHYHEKYKEHAPDRYAGTVARVIASGKTPAGSHRPIMVEEILNALAPQPGEIILDCTLGFGGHAQALLPRVLPGGRLIGLDVDPLELPRTEARLREAGFGSESFTAIRTNFAGVTKALIQAGISRVDCLLADLGVSSMQLDDPNRGFSFKFAGPLDLRMNPQRGVSAAQWLSKATAPQVAQVLREYSDEPRAEQLADVMAGQHYPGTLDLANAIKSSLPRLKRDEQVACIRRVFQALRIVVNDELTALEGLLRQLPEVLKPRGRAAILTFHSGEDRRVKHAFSQGAQQGLYELHSPEMLRPSQAEQHDNPRSSPAKLRVVRMR